MIQKDHKNGGSIQKLKSASKDERWLGFGIFSLITERVETPLMKYR